jgi:nucleoside phosphorylase
LLREIFDGALTRRPNHIICLSAYKEALAELGEEAQKRLVHCVEYDEFNDHWAERLSEKAIYVKKRIDSIAVLPSSFGCDIGIVTSYPIAELSGVLEFCPDSCSEFNSIDEVHYYRSKWQAVDRELSVVVCAAPSMGMTAACVTASKLISRWRPRYLAMSGIAAGTSTDVTYGDVIVAESCYDYGSGKIIELPDGERKFVASPQQIPISPRLRALLQRWEANQSGMLELGAKWQRDRKFVPRMKLGVLATGAAVVQSKGLVTEILATSRKVAGLEMEGYGIFQAATLSSLPKPEVIVAKAVCDFADIKKDDDYHRMAAFTSAGFLHNFFTQERDLDFDS